MSTASERAEAVATRLANITVANGYKTDIGQRVFRGRRTIDADESVPCVTIVEADDTRKKNTEMIGTKVHMVADFELLALVKCDPDNPNDAAHDAIADMKRAIFTGDRRFDGFVRDLDYIGRSIGVRHDGVDLVSASIRFTMSYVEDLANP